jgi:cytoskeleton protein RodZ
MLSAGQMLKEAREKLNLTRAEVAEHIYLRAQVIIDLENDHYAQLGAEVYIRGYLRNYAKMVNLSPETVLMAFETIYQPLKKKTPSKPLLKEPRQKRCWHKKLIRQHFIKIIMILVIALGAVLIVNWYGRKQLLASKVIAKNTKQLVSPIELPGGNSTISSS